MRRDVSVWGIGLGILTAYELWAVWNHRKGDTLSECVRVVFHTDTPEGRRLFEASWDALSAWFVPHITGEPR